MAASLGPVPGATVAVAFYDPEENAVVIFHGVLEIFEDHYILRDPMMLTPEGPRPQV